MIVEKMQIKDWRCFKGVHDIEFTTDSDKRITIILATNGVGKTNFMNTFLWCLHGETTENFEKPEDIVNRDVNLFDEKTKKPTKRINSYIRLTVNIEGQRFNIKRSLNSLDSKKTLLKVFHVNQKGVENERQGDPQTFVNTYIPPSMAKYFFFDGEGAIQMLKSTKKGKEDLKKSVMTIIGLDPAKTALNKIQELAKKKKIERAKLFENLEGAEGNLSEALERINGEILEIEDTGNETGELYVLRRELAEIESKLENKQEEVNQVKNIAEILKKKQALYTAKNIAKKSLDEAEKKARTAISDDQITSILMIKAGNDALSVIKENKNPKYPGDIHKSIIKQLLENKECICGRGLNNKEDKDAVNCVTEQLTNATTEDAAEIYATAKNRAEVYANFNDLITTSLWKTRSEYQSAQTDFEGADDNLKNDKSSTAVRNPNEKKILNEYEQLEDESKAKFREIVLIENKLKELKNEFEEIEKKIKVKGDRGKEASEIDKVIKLLNITAITISESIKLIEIEAKDILEKETNKSLNEYWSGDLFFKLEKDYSMIVNTHIKDKPLSGGEKSLVAQTFISHLIKYCISRKDDAENIEEGSGSWLLKGAELPFVIDSPFGHLGENYTIAASNVVANSKAQVIYMLSETQARKDVVAEVDKYVGKVYAMVGDRLGASNSEKNKNTKNTKLIWGKRKPIDAINFNKKTEEANFIEL